MNTLLDRACDASLKIKFTSIASDHSGVPVWRAESPEAKMWHAMKSGCSSSAFEERCLEGSNANIWLAEQMATIPMIPVGPVTTLNRSVLLTERRMSCTGGDDFICGHCGHVMLEG